ncbi:MAG TPA: ATP-binding protein, partial [Byssovorax sp.]
MTRSHAPALLTIVAAAITREHLFARGDVVLLAVSGGPDSTALLHVLARLRAKLGHSLVAHGVDHGLRAEAASELDRAAAFAETLD